MLQKLQRRRPLLALASPSNGKIHRPGLLGTTRHRHVERPGVETVVHVAGPEAGGVGLPAPRLQDFQLLAAYVGVQVQRIAYPQLHNSGNNHKAQPKHPDRGRDLSRLRRARC